VADGHVIRVAEVGKPVFQLRKGEEGLSVFEAYAVSPPLTEAELLDAFRENSQLVERSKAEIEQKGLIVVAVEGADPLPRRLQLAHSEIRPGNRMTRSQFKQALKELE